MSLFISQAFASSAGHAAEPFYMGAEFWVVVTFLLVVALLYRPGAKSLRTFTAARAEAIRTKLDDSRKVKEDAHNLLLSYQRKLREAENESALILERAQAEAAKIKVAVEETIEAMKKRHEAQADLRLKLAAEKVEEELKEFAVSLSISIAREALLASVNDAVDSKLNARIIQEIPERFHGTEENIPLSV